MSEAATAEKNNLEIQGTISKFSVAELLAEIAQEFLSGSLRISSGEKKIVVYFEAGEVVFAVSNSKKHRLYEILLSQNLLTPKQLSEIENFSNDLFLAKTIVQKKLAGKQDVNAYLIYQINRILYDILKWTDGEWLFSSLARIKSGISFPVRLSDVLQKYGENLRPDLILERFKTPDEIFSIKENGQIPTNDFSPKEAFVLTRLDQKGVTVRELAIMSGSENFELMPFLYKLWLGGFLIRKNWDSAFDKKTLENIASANVTLKRSALSVDEEMQRSEEEKKRQAEEEQKRIEAERKAKQEAEAKEKSNDLTLDEYLERVEKSVTFYEVFDVSTEAKISEIKKAYFTFAKKFHPDLYQKRVEPKLQKRIQDAFTEIAQAYETLKDDEAREIYNFKLRKVIEALKEEESKKDNDELISRKLTKEDMQKPDQKQIAADSFEQGYDHLMKENISEALPLLGRAVQLDDDNARYHAFYGKALSYDKKKRHQAEGELQTAVKLNSDNTLYRFMLSELYLEIGLLVRAKGELTRLLSIDPNHQDAKNLLDSLNK